MESINWARKSDNGYEVSSLGDRRFSAFYARLNNGKTIEEMYQLYIKGYRSITEQCLEGKGKPAIVPFYTGVILPSSNVIFVFGSNPEGRHGLGAALTAREKFSAKYGVGEGITGRAYALPTKDLRIKENNSLRSISPENIKASIAKLYDYARNNPDLRFKVAYKNTSNASLNGYTGYELMYMFHEVDNRPSNIIFSEEWAKAGILMPISRETQWKEYKALWERYLDENPDLEADLIRKSLGKELTDMFASSDINQARALAELLTERINSQIQ